MRSEEISSVAIHDNTPPIIFVTFGLTVLDEIRHPSLGTMNDVVGGSGTFAMLGARSLIGPNASRSLGWILRKGKDFPDHAQKMIESWNTTLYIQEDPIKPSTRGLLEYRDSTFGPKNFRYTSERLTVSPNNELPDHLKRAASFHFLADPDGFERQIDDLMHLRRDMGLTDEPVIIWEPAPPTCNVEMFQSYCRAARKASIFSPNHIELAKLFGITDHSDVSLTNELLESLVMKFLGRVGEQNQLCIVVRAAESGCLVSSAPSKLQWFPAYHDYTKNHCFDKAVVIDPTGAGNAFLGAFAIGYHRSGDTAEAACYGAIGASFAIEQIGLPILRIGDTGEEEWNGDQVEMRLESYKRRLAKGKS